MSDTWSSEVPSEPTAQQPNPQPASYAPRETTILLVAGLAAVQGLINAIAGFEQAHQSTSYARVYLLLAAVEIVWAALLVRWDSRELLVFGFGFALLLLGVWTYVEVGGVSEAGSRGGIHAIFWCAAKLGGATSGWHTRVAEVVQPLSQLVVVLALASVLLSATAPFARRIVASLPAVVLGALLLTILYGVGAHGA